VRTGFLARAIAAGCGVVALFGMNIAAMAAGGAQGDDGNMTFAEFVALEGGSAASGGASADNEALNGNNDAGRVGAPARKPRMSRRQRLAALMRKKGLRRGDPIFIRIFKQEKELELWMRAGRKFTLLKTYPICRLSGHIGPKLRERDYQSPEGFYTVTRARLKPDSKYHRAFNLGFPNAYDRAWGRSGSFLMIHGGCRSVGCFAMTNKGVEEIYGLADAALSNGQKSFDVHIFPFRMSAVNMDKYAKHRWSSFWWNLKEGHDLFERSLLPPIVSNSGRKYVFSPAPEPDISRRVRIVAAASSGRMRSARSTTHSLRRSGGLRRKAGVRRAVRSHKRHRGYVRKARKTAVSATPFSPFKWKNF
jgi:murein L,D-transpeptidase YafK